MLSTLCPPSLPDKNSSHERYFAIPSTAILTHNGRGFSVFEARFSNRIFRELTRIAHDGETLAGLICDNRGAIDRSSVRALNVYLRTHRGIVWPERCRSEPMRHGIHRWAWFDFSDLVGLRWRN